MNPFSYQTKSSKTPFSDLEQPFSEQTLPTEPTQNPIEDQSPSPENNSNKSPSTSAYEEEFFEVLDGNDSSYSDDATSKRRLKHGRTRPDN